MCSFIGIVSKDQSLINEIKLNIDHKFQKLKYRGPDISNCIKYNKNTLLCGFVLAINDSVGQPLYSNDSWMLWNGEIYNYNRSYTNDSKYLFNFLNNKGIKKINNLDGEYAICYFKDSKLHLITDSFYTKPLCFSIEDGLIIFSSYESAIREVKQNAQVVHALPNTHYVINTDTYVLEKQEEVYSWDFEPRYNTYDNWLESYKQSIIKRCDTDKKLFLPMSSGYDSGGICSELISNQIPITVYTYKGVEHKKTLANRVKIINSTDNSSHHYVDIFSNFDSDFLEFYNKVENHIAYHYDGKPYLDIYHAYSCFAHYYICREAKKTGHTICLSGHGADEVYSDYNTPRTVGVSVVRGDYAGWRRKWPNFDMGYGRNILGMFDRVAGCVGVETRYPYLDRDTVQNFLWLSDELKNRNYKQCLHKAMSLRKFPFDINNKSPLRVAEGDTNNNVFKSKLINFYKEHKIQKPSYIQ
tara:strand:+ start:2320 stop:3729 length:1410 start_codon:yes stop_codon:yes gene_type:complete